MSWRSVSCLVLVIFSILELGAGRNIDAESRLHLPHLPHIPHIPHLPHLPHLHWPHWPHRTTKAPTSEPTTEPPSTSSTAKPHWHWPTLPHWPHRTTKAPTSEPTTEPPTTSSTAKPHWHWPTLPHWPHRTTKAPTSEPTTEPPTTSSTAKPHWHWPTLPHLPHRTTKAPTSEPTSASPTTSSTSELTTTTPEPDPSTTSSPIEPTTSSRPDNPTTANPVNKGYQWVLRDAGTLPLGCSFVYGGSTKDRLLYVGRVNINDQLVPAAIHHYSSAGNEYYTAISNGEITTGRESVEWLCSDYGVAWVRVKDFSPDVLKTFKAVEIGWNSETNSPTYACLSHSFYNNKYPPSVGQVVGNQCQFVVGDDIVSTENFNWWHTLELLVTLED